MSEADSIQITHFGAVSPAGWTAADLVAVARGEVALPDAEGIERDGKRRRHSVRRVPKAKLPFLRHPRLRRASPIGRFCAGAMFDALGDRDPSSLGRVGVVLSSVNGCVNYSARFYGEVLEDPSLASPIVFPETVFNAPASHLSAALESSAINYTIIGDSTSFMSGLEIAARWLLDDRCDSAFVVAGEEYDFLCAEGWQFLDRKTDVFSEGAGALLLERGPSTGGVALQRITDPILYTAKTDRVKAIEAVRGQIEAAGRDRIEVRREIVGEGIGARVAWQCVLGAAAVADGTSPSVSILAAGGTQQAVGAVFGRV